MSGKKQSKNKQKKQMTLTALFKARSSRPQVQLQPGEAKGVRGPADAFGSPAQVDTFKEYTEAISGMYGGPVA
jgi:hypothetical protein